MARLGWNKMQFKTYILNLAKWDYDFYFLHLKFHYQNDIGIFYPHDNSWGSTIEAVICMYVCM